MFIIKDNLCKNFYFREFDIKGYPVYSCYIKDAMKIKTKDEANAISSRINNSCVLEIK